MVAHSLPLYSLDKPVGPGKPDLPDHVVLQKSPGYVPPGLPRMDASRSYTPSLGSRSGIPGDTLRLPWAPNPFDS
ncbi:MAG: hypothetical protein FJW31_19810 [Acidobacteria bacterium]|nr:hypothetical protein [Acidobacteriota bacterium]